MVKLGNEDPKIKEQIKVVDNDIEKQSQSLSSDDKCDKCNGSGTAPKTGEECDHCAGRGHYS